MLYINFFISQNFDLYLNHSKYGLCNILQRISIKVDSCINFYTEVMKGSIIGVIDIQWFNSIVVQWSPSTHSNIAYEAPFNFLGLSNVRSFTHNRCRCLIVKFISFSKLIKANMFRDEKSSNLRQNCSWKTDFKTVNVSVT